MKLTGHKNLVAWQKAIRYADFIYSITDAFPKHEQFGLTQQVRRACVSVPSNLAEGSARGKKEFAYFVSVSRGSLAEVETQCIIAHLRGYIENEMMQRVTADTDELNRILIGLSKSLKQSN